MIFPNNIYYNPKTAKTSSVIKKKQQDKIEPDNPVKIDESNEQKKVEMSEKKKSVLTGKQVNDIINRMRKAKKKSEEK